MAEEFQPKVTLLNFAIDRSVANFRRSMTMTPTRWGNIKVANTLVCSIEATLEEVGMDSSVVYETIYKQSMFNAGIVTWPKGTPHELMLKTASVAIIRAEIGVRYPEIIEEDETRIEWADRIARNQ